MLLSFLLSLPVKNQRNMEIIKYEEPAISILQYMTEGILCASGTEDVELDHGEW
jgi:hypothetical protein